ncbi:MAG: zinc ABC transporter substrate-binding protein [Burkholderiaceae bacterium]|nr:zinc ABC transporter substrate-binding protein [Burkholderiaceae bacterium]MCX7901020.1 zinc ABC transporter substrate-binding protein [Burkholderiaceae bacterium]
MRFERLRRAGLALAALAWAQTAQALAIFACEPEWAALVRVLAPQARVFVATHAGQDPHQIEARPALIAQLRRADLVVCTGASLEAGWLPALQQRAGNPKARDVFFAADHVEVIDPQPAAIGTPWSGDVHAEGNPHVHADPRNLLLVAQALAQRLGAERPAERDHFAARLAAFETRWRARIARWEQEAAILRGKKVAAQHTTFGYLWRWLGIEQIADLEPRPGMPPTPGHLQRLLAGLRAAPPMAIVLASYQDARAGRWLAGQLGGSVPLLVLPATVGEQAAEEELAQWFDGLLQQLLRAARAR